MRLYEVIASAPGNNMKRLYMLKQMIEHGEKPEISDSSLHVGHFTWGDLERLKYAKKFSERFSGRVRREYWKYTGPNAIILVTTVNGQERRMEMKTDDETKPTDSDYS
jgi:hypothetical protein